MRAPLAVLLLASIPLLAQAPCDCIDKGDIKERIKLASAAIDAYGKEVETIGMAPYTPKGRVDLQARVNRAMGAARTPGRASMMAKGWTTNNCDIEVKAPTKCLEAAIRAHEKVHQDACRATWEKHQSAILRGKAADRFQALGMTMMGYMMEELSGYQAEIMFLSKELARLQRDCQPPPVKRHYSSGATAYPNDTPPPSDSDHSRDPKPTGAESPKPTGPRPMVKPKPLPVPKPIGI